MIPIECLKRPVYPLATPAEVRQCLKKVVDEAIYGAGQRRQLMSEHPTPDPRYPTVTMHLFSIAMGDMVVIENLKGEKCMVPTAQLQELGLETMEKCGIDLNQPVAVTTGSDSYFKYRRDVYRCAIEGVFFKREIQHQVDIEHPTRVTWWTVDPQVFKTEDGLITSY